MIMRKALITAALVAASAVAGAQNYKSADDSLRLAGCDYVYTPVMRRLTPAPKGYKALAIEHYGRHGARYCWQNDLYTDIRDTLSRADSLGLLTPAGKAYRSQFEDIFPEVRYHEEELSRKGWEQHRGIAEVMYKSFPEVFKGKQSVSANASNSIRCIMSMASFCLSLSDCNPELDIREVSGRSWYPGVIPHSHNNPYASKYEHLKLPYEENPWTIRDSYYDTEAILGKLFTDIDAAVAKDGQVEFLEELYIFANGMQSLDTDMNFSWIFTAEERYKMWELDNFKGYGGPWGNRICFLPILDDLIAKGDEHIAEGRKGADLRFGHDTCLIPLLMLIGINGYDRYPDTWQEIKGMFQNWNIPMGGNIQIILYSSRRGGETLFKILLNGEEASLPAFEAVSGPYYKWSDLKARAEDLHKYVKQD